MRMKNGSKKWLYREITNYSETCIFIKLRASLPDFRGRHMVIVAKIVATLWPALTNNTIITNVRSVLNNMTGWAAEGL